MNKKNNTNSIKGSLIMGFVWLLIWFAAAFAIGSDLILPGPVKTIQALAKLICTSGFWLDVLFTLFRVFAGAVISLAAGFVCAALASGNKAVREFLRLPVSFFKSIPVMAIIIYVILVVKADWVAIVVCILMCFPIAYTNMLSGMTSMSREFDELGEVLGLTSRQKRSIILRPELQPEIRASVDLIMGMSWKVVVASEVLAIPGHSIGYQMLNSKYYLETPDLFAYIIVLIILSLAVEKLASRIVDLDYRRVGARVREEVNKAVPAHSAVSEKGDASGDVNVGLENISKSFLSEDGAVKKVLSSITMKFGKGITALLGPSGEGKTTVARLIMGLEKPDEGTVKTEPDVKPDVLFQEDRLLPWLTVEENMMLTFIGRHNVISEEPNKAITEMAEKLEISDSLNRMPDELSGGMAHRVALGRALMGGSRLLILDEPMRGIDASLQKRLTEKLEDDVRRNRRGEERTVIMITHDEELAEEYADRSVRI